MDEASPGRGDKKKVSKDEILKFAVVNIGLSEDEFMDMMPKDYHIEQLRYMEKKEDVWEYVRQILAMIHNTSDRAKRSLSPRQIIELERDKQVNDYEIDDEWARKALKALN